MNGWSPATIDAAGERLREWWASGRMTDVVIREDLELLNLFRRDPSGALNASAMGLRSAARTRGISPAAVTQRTKQVNTIVHKLHRHRDLTLSTMIDVLGCRIVVPQLDDAYAVLDQLRSISRRQIDCEFDYVASARRTGYRALHLHTRSHDRLVEVQIRTTRQQAWADESERLQAPYGDILRDGGGPSEITDYLAAVGSVLAAEDRGEDPGQQRLERLAVASAALKNAPSVHRGVSLSW